MKHAPSLSAWRTHSHIRRGRVVKTRDFKALRPWRRVKYLFLHVYDQNMFGLNTYMPRVATTRSRDGCGSGHSDWSGPRECLSAPSPLSVSHRTTDRSATAARDAISRLLSEGFLRRTRMMLCTVRMRTDTEEGGGKEECQTYRTGQYWVSFCHDHFLRRTENMAKITNMAYI